MDVRHSSHTLKPNIVGRIKNFLDEIHPLKRYTLKECLSTMKRGWLNTLEKASES